MPAANGTSSIKSSAATPKKSVIIQSEKHEKEKNTEEKPNSGDLIPDLPSPHIINKTKEGLLKDSKEPNADQKEDVEASQDSEPPAAPLVHSTKPNTSSSAKSTPYQKVLQALNHDEKWQKDVALGRRVGFYRLKGDLGSGNFSQVKLGLHCLTKEKVAIKILDKSKLDNKTQLMLNREISIMEQLCHPNVIQLYEVIQSLSKEYLVLEYANGGDLFARVTNSGRMSEQQSKTIFSQIVSAVDYMHSRNIIHRDLKSENVFFCQSDTVKVGDLGFSTTIHSVDQALRTFCGSPPYAAPELFQDDSYIGTPVDVWALGILLFFMVSGYMPFRAQTVAALKKLILDGEFEIPSHVSLECAALIRGILRKSFRDRYTMAQVVDSAWLRDNMAALGNPVGTRRKWGQRVPSSKVTTSRYMYHPWPRLPVESRDDLEVHVRGRLHRLGITDDMIKEAMKDGCHSPVIGTYRLLADVTNKQWKQRKGSQCSKDSDTVETHGELNERTAKMDKKTMEKLPNVANKVTPGANKKSRTCTVI